MMLRRTTIVLLWVGAALACTGIVFAAVTGVAGGIVEQPGPTLPEAVGAGDGSVVALHEFPDGSSGAPAPQGQASTSSPSSTSPASSAPSTTSGGSSTSAPSTSGAPSTSVTSSTSPTSTSVTSTSVTSTTAGSSSTTSPPVATQTKTYQLVGGWMRIAYGPGVVKLDGAAPNAGFTMDVKDTGPDKARVEFRSDSHRSEIEVRWRNGGLDEDIRERQD